MKCTSLLQSQVSAGGSLSNTLLALARLGAAEHVLHGRGALRVAMDGIIGGDPLSEFYNSQMRRAGVQVLARPSPCSCTGEPPRFPDTGTVLQCLVVSPADADQIATRGSTMCVGILWHCGSKVQSVPISTYMCVGSCPGHGRHHTCQRRWTFQVVQSLGWLPCYIGVM